MTTPTGDPPWVRSADSSTYGGHVGKHDYQQQGVTNPLTDIAAAEFLRTVNDLAAIVKPAPFATLLVQCNDTVPAAPTIQWIMAMNGSRSTPYAGGAAPTGMPTGTRNSDGNITLQWPASLTDSYGVSAPLEIAGVVASASGYVTTYTIDDARTITVAAVSGADTAILIRVW